ncbi:MAG: hypothetical protein R3C70_07190 [Geminicoccaceae bacterium]
MTETSTESDSCDCEQCQILRLAKRLVSNHPNLDDLPDSEVKIDCAMVMTADLLAASIVKIVKEISPDANDRFSLVAQLMNAMMEAVRPENIPNSTFAMPTAKSASPMTTH